MEGLEGKGTRGDREGEGGTRGRENRRAHSGERKGRLGEGREGIHLLA